MRVLAFASQKSGAGKTTLAGHVAVQAQRAGTTPVVLVDLDPDASLTDWFALREEDDEPLTVARSSLKDLSTKLEQLRADGVKLVVIDTPPTLHHAIDEFIIAADLVAIPTRPCAHDLAAAGATVELVQNDGKPFCFIVNSAEPEGEVHARRGDGVGPAWKHCDGLHPPQRRHARQTIVVALSKLIRRSF